MSKDPRNNKIDGFFVPRRERQQGAGMHRPGLDNLNRTPTSDTEGGLRLQRRQAAPVGGNVDDFFQTNPANPTTTIAAEPAPLPEAGQKKEKQGLFSRLKAFRFRRPTRKTVKWAAIIFLILLVLVGIFFIVRFFLAGNQVFKGNVFNAIFTQGRPLKMDANGRSNIVLFGTSEDDPGHEGAELADSIMLVSIDQKKKDAFMVSVPRDLWVDYGMACLSGYEGKVNEVYMCGKANGNDKEDAGQKAIRDKVGEIFGLDMHYSVHLNYSALRQAVDAVGGITVKIESDDPRGILDRNFDWKCRYQCHYVKWPNGPAKLDGEHALALARARGSIAPTYGLAGGNFDREQYQQKILLALKSKAASAGTLANPVAVNNLISALGDNVRTNIDAEEVRTLANLGQDITAEKIKTLSLLDEKNPLVTTGNVNGASVVQPVAGLYDYGKIHAAVNAFATGDTAYLEGALVDVLNASGQPGVAQTKADELSKKGITVEVIGNAPASLKNKGSVQLYDLSGGAKPGTLKKLETVLGVKAIKQMPAGVTSNSDFIIIIGSNGAS